jgi:hypothetical protein
MPVAVVLLMVQLFAPGDAFGQPTGGSLTDHFPRMSAKERNRIATQETSDAAKDVGYQDVMQRAERSFQEGRYEEALQGYEQARSMRPYNVYPKVKIEDLRALIAKQASAVPAMAAEPSVPPEADPVGGAMNRPPTVRQPALTTIAQPTAARPGAAPAGVVPAPPPAPVRLAAASGVIERRYKEGHAHVIERVVTVHGRTVIYKRVFHAWGQVFYFEDGSPVDERVWKARFP